MRSRAARLTIGVLAWVALGAAASVIFLSNKQIVARRGVLVSFDLRATETAGVLADAGAGQQAYFAEGQGAAFWMAKVDELLMSASRSIDGLRQGATSQEAGSALLEAATSVSTLGSIDQKARDYIRSGQPLMAADVVFAEGGGAAAAARRQVESARLAEREAFDAFEARSRILQATAAAAAGAWTLLVVSLLALASPAAARPAGDETASPDVTSSPANVLDLHVPLPAAQAVVSAGIGKPPAELTQNSAPSQPGVSARPGDTVTETPARSETGSIGKAERGAELRLAAELCTALGRVASLDELHALLGRAADLIGATGVIVWIGSADGADLHALAAHGYSAKALAGMPVISRTDQNAAAAAYRTGAPQVVAARKRSEAGAVVVPLLAPDGCVGALTAEIANGEESSALTEALASIVAAQLVGVLGGTALPQTSRGARPALGAGGTR